MQNQANQTNQTNKANQTNKINKVKVKSEKAATRCEICHQSDLFDPETEDCLRCSQVEKALATKPPVTISLWSPRFALIERETPPPASYKRMFYLMLTDLIALPITLVLESYLGILVTLFLALILGTICLSKRYDLRKMFNTSIDKALTGDDDSRQITTIFDKHPEIGVEGRREPPTREYKITTIFGDNDRKNN